MALMQSWFTKACNMLSSTWRSQGVPDSDEVASEEFLKQLATEYADKIKQNGVRAEWTIPSSQQITSITVDDEDFDCRVGKRAQKRRREAKTVGDSKQRPSGTKGGKRKKLKADGKGSGKTRASQKAAGKSVEKESATASMLPPGWQALEETGSRNKSGHDVFLTWDGIEIKGLDGVKRYCQETGIQLPKNLSTMPDIEEYESYSAEQLYRWMIEAGRSGCLPASRVLPIAAIKARQKLWQGLPVEEMVSDVGALQ